jgi:rhodanese-related sulfurtransferase
MSPHGVPTVSPRELRAELESASPPNILDVREPHELEISRLPKLVHIPLGDLGRGFKGLDSEADWVVVCRSGARSAQATAFLLAQGFRRVRNLGSGMNGYAQTSDLSLSVY